MDNNGGKSGLALGLLIGAIAGVAVGMLMAPKAGSQVRLELRDAMQHGMERVQSGMDRVQSGVERIRHRRHGEET